MLKLFPKTFHTKSWNLVGRVIIYQTCTRSNVQTAVCWASNQWIGYSEGHWKPNGVNRYRLLALCTQPLGQIPGPFFHTSIHSCTYMCACFLKIFYWSLWKIPNWYYFTWLWWKQTQVAYNVVDKQPDDLLVLLITYSPIQGTETMAWHSLCRRRVSKDSNFRPSVNHLLLRARRV